MEKIGNILIHLLKKKGFYEPMMEHHSVQIYNQEIVKEFPDIGESRASDIKNGILFVTVPNPMLNWQMNLKKQEIIDRLNHIYGKKIILDIYTKIEG